MTNVPVLVVPVLVRLIGLSVPRTRPTTPTSSTADSLRSARHRRRKAAAGALERMGKAWQVSSAMVTAEDLSVGDSHSVNHPPTGQTDSMARPTRKSADPTKPLLRRPSRIGSLDTEALIGMLRHLHETAEDPDVERMPADDELFRALLYLESHAHVLKDQDARRKAALERVRLWEYLREQADRHQARAIADARAAQAQWTDLAPVLAVNTPSAAYNKAARLKAATLADDPHNNQPVRRTPEAVAEAERQRAARAAAEHRARQEASRRHMLLVPVARQLLEHRDDFVDDEEADYWLDEIAEVLPYCETPTQKVSLSTYVEAAVRELQRAERRTALPAAATDEARRALAAAAQLVSR